MVFTIVNDIDFTLRKYKNTKMAIWHITTHFVVEGHISVLRCLRLAATPHPSPPPPPPPTTDPPHKVYARNLSSW